jgi:hypothetical protein
MSNHPYPTEQQARAAASIAYPNTSTAPGRPAAPVREGRPPTALTFLLMLAALWRWYRRARRSTGGGV